MNLLGIRDKTLGENVQILLAALLFFILTSHKKGYFMWHADVTCITVNIRLNYFTYVSINAI